jgi:hypothetical protein
LRATGIGRPLIANAADQQHAVSPLGSATNRAALG